MNRKIESTPCHGQGMIRDRNPKLEMLIPEEDLDVRNFSLARKGSDSVLSILGFRREDRPPSW